MKNFKVKWLLLSFILSIASINTAWAGTYTVVGVAMDNAKNYYPRYSVNIRGENYTDVWRNACFADHKAGITFEGKKLYLANWTDNYDGAQDLYFQQYSTNCAGDDQVNYNTVFSNNWTGVSNYNKKIWLYNETSPTGGSWYSVLTMTQSKVYFDATGWSETDIDLCIAHMNYQAYYGMTNVANTKLYYTNESYSWEDAMGFGVVGGHSRTDGQSANGNYWITDVSDYSEEYTGFKHTELNNNGANYAYLVVNAGKAGQQPTVSSNSSYATLLNSTQTIESYVSTDYGSSYSKANSKATITITSYAMTSQGTSGATASNGSLSTSANSTTVTAARTATTTLSVGDVAEGYVFVGWYNSSNSLLSTETSYTYYPTGATTIRARFKNEVSHTVTISNYCTTNSTIISSSSRGIGESTAVAITAPGINDHTFTNWTLGNGMTNRSANLNANPISVTTGGAGSTYTMRANYTLKNCSISVCSTSNDSGDGTKYNMTYDYDEHAYYYDMASSPANLYFRFVHADGGKWSGNWNGSSPNVYNVNANGDKVTCNTDVSGWDNKATLHFPGLTGSTIRIWFDYQNKKVWITETAYTVTINNGDYGTVSPNGSQTIGPNSGKSITAYPATGYRFTEWTKTGNAVLSSTTDNPTTVTATNTGTVTANYAQRYVLRGSTKNDHSVAGGMAGWEATDNSSYTSFTMAGTTMTIQATLLASTDYSFNLRDEQNSSWCGQTGSGYIPASTEWTLNGTSEVHFTSTIAGVYTFIFDLSSTPAVKITFPNLYIVGDFNGWATDTPFDENGKVTVSLTAGEHKFKVQYNGSWYGDGSLNVTTSSVVDHALNTGGGDETNCTITVSSAGVYTFGWDANNHKVSVYVPADKDEIVLTKNKYIYFDARRLTGSNSDYWQRGEFTARFWFKNFASAADIRSVDCSHDNELDKWVYYAVVPDNDGIGRIQMNRVPVSSEETCASNVVHAYSRTSSKQNCIAEEVGHENYCNDWNPSWTTYCPPMSSASLSDNSTSKISWQDGGNDGSTSGKAILVSTANTIEVSGAATKALDDANMTINYDFIVNSSSEQAGSGNTYSKGSLSNNTLYTVTMQAYNAYNGATGTKLTASETLYYKALNMYSVTHTKSHVTSSGRSGAGAAAYGLPYTATFTADTHYHLPDAITVKFGETTKTVTTDYTWDSSTGVVSILASKIDGNVTIIVTAVPDVYDVTLNTNDGAITSGDVTEYSYSIGATLPTAVAKAGYTFAGWYANSSLTGDVVESIGTSEYGDKEFWAKWTPNTLTFNGTVSGHETEWNNTGNWSEACVPTIEHNVIIDKPVVVNITNAVAKSVKIYNKESTAHTGKLTIGAGKALVVAEDIKKTEDGSTKIATTADVLHIEAGDGSTGNGALVWGTSGTPGNAQVDFYTAALGVKGNTTSKNQYIGTPFSNDQQVLYQFYYSWVYKIEYSDGEPYWTPLASNAAMNEFEGYDLISAYNAATTYQMEGTLVSNGNVTLTTGTTPALYYNGSSKTENVLANSWVAPIKINTMDVTNNFSNVEGTIYIFNMGSETDGSGGTGGGAGNYSTYTIGSAGETVIPSMQSFSVYTTGSSPSLTLNYTNSVKTPVANGTMNSANRAPARNLADEMDLLKLNVASENGWGDELKFYIHEDFSTEFENGWDGHKMFGYPEAPQLYAVSNDGELAVACVPTAENNVLGFTPGSEDNEYTFSFTYDGDEEYYLKDTKLNIETLINTEATYTFTSEAEDSDMRFIIIKRAPAVATDAETVSGDWLAVSGVQKIMHNGQLYIIRDGGIYDATGTMVK